MKLFGQVTSRFSRSWSLGRPRRPVAVGIVVAAALCMVVAAVVLRAGVNGTTGSTRTAAEPGATALGGHWDPNGPRLDRRPARWSLRVITLSDGTTTYQPRAQMNLSGGAKFDARRVIGVSVARATPESFTKEFLPWHAENLTSAQRAAIMKYLRSPAVDNEPICDERFVIGRPDDGNCRVRSCRVETDMRSAV